MSKESGVSKWFSRLKEYGYINPNDGGEEGHAPHSTADDGGQGKVFEDDCVDFDLIDQGKEPKVKNVVPRPK